MTYHRLNTTGATSGAGTVYLYEAPKFTPVFSGVCVTRSLVVYVCFVFCPFVPFLLAIVFSVLLRFTDLYYTSGIF